VPSRCCDSANPFQGTILIADDLAHPTFTVLAPGELEVVSPLIRRYFLAASDAAMKAYEYTTHAQPKISQHARWLSLFSQAIVEHGMQRVSALGVRALSSLGDCTEVEFVRYQATVFVEDLDLPNRLQTDWTNPC